MARKNQPSALIHTMACLYLVGRTHPEIAEIVGRTRENVTRSLESPTGQDILTRIRQETQAQIFDPVTQQLDSYAREAMDELWAMRDTVESEKLRKDIFIDVLHMAGYRPHTNTDRQAEQLPTIVMGQVNMQVNMASGEGPNPGPIPVAAKLALPEDDHGYDEDEQTGAGSGKPQRQHETGQEYTPVEASDDPRFESVGRWSSGEVEHGPDSESSVGSGDARGEQFEPTFTVEQ
jgi:hypothetical protein